MTHIEKHNPNDFANYLNNFENTICGRHPIGVLLNIINSSQYNSDLKTEFVHYEQSN